MTVPAAYPEAYHWKVVHAKAVGTSHLKNNLPCQDAVDWRLLPSGMLAIALADGAGSASLAEVGANIAVHQALRLLETTPANDTPEAMDAWGNAIHEAFSAARSALIAESETTGLPLSSYATTLICLVAARDGLVIGQVGDGAVIAQAPSGDLFTLTQPMRGEYANETLFLTMPDAMARGFFQAIELDLAGLAVMSDGLIRLALQMPAYTPHAPFFSPLWAFAAKANSDTQPDQALAAFLASERVCARTDDDKSLAVAVLEGFENQANNGNATDPETRIEG